MSTWIVQPPVSSPEFFFWSAPRTRALATPVDDRYCFKFLRMRRRAGSPWISPLAVARLRLLVADRKKNGLCWRECPTSWQLKEIYGIKKYICDSKWEGSSWKRKNLSRSKGMGSTGLEPMTVWLRSTALPSISERLSSQLGAGPWHVVENEHCTSKYFTYFTHTQMHPSLSFVTWHIMTWERKAGACGSDVRTLNRHIEQKTGFL